MGVKQIKSKVMINDYDHMSSIGKINSRELFLSFKGPNQITLNTAGCGV